MQYYQIIYKGEVAAEVKIDETKGAEFINALKQMDGVSCVPLKSPMEKPATGGIGAAMVRAMIEGYERRNQY